MEIILLFIRLILFGVFAVAGVAKLFDLKGSEKAVKDFGIPDDLVKPIATVLPIVEIAIAVMLLPLPISWFGSIAALFLLLLFIGGMVYQMAQGKAPDCHCFGQIHSEPVSKKSIVRNAVFALFALVLALSGPSSQGLSLVNDSTSAFEVIFGVGMMALLGAAVYYLKNILKQQVDLSRKIEILGFVAGGDAKVERNEAGDPNDGLPIGSPLPDFSAPDINGRILTFDHLLAKRKPLLFFFVSPTCSPCEALMPEIEEWEADLKDKLEFVFVSSGTQDENRVKFGGDPSRTILIEKGREFADAVYAKWTPTALYVNADGNVASHPAAGDSEIRRLVGKIETADLMDEHVFFVGVNSNGKPKIGKSVPEFAASDLTGREISEADFQGKKTVAAFISLTCSHCVTLINQIREWEKSKSADDPEFILFSEGEAAEHQQLGLKSPIIIEKDYETAKKLGMYGVPSGVVVDETGTIVSEAAVGPSNIWALIGRKVDAPKSDDQERAHTNGNGHAHG
ncbi:MAG: MauE/DoxX family redox-associated membrane protein [Pyrinomonadaceae bacterium]